MSTAASVNSYSRPPSRSTAWVSAAFANEIGSSSMIFASPRAAAGVAVRMYLETPSPSGSAGTVQDSSIVPPALPVRASMRLIACGGRMSFAASSVRLSSAGLGPAGSASIRTAHSSRAPAGISNSQCTQPEPAAVPAAAAATKRPSTPASHFSTRRSRVQIERCLPKWKSRRRLLVSVPVKTTAGAAVLSSRQSFPCWGSSRPMTGVAPRASQTA